MKNSEKRKKFLIFGRPLIEGPEIKEVIDTLKSGWVGTGPKVKKFEEMFKHYKGSKHAIALSSCSAALHLSMIAIGIEPGDEVILPAMTFASTACAVMHMGAKPVLVDCRKETMNMDPSDIEKKITKKTKAIIVVHFAGRPCDMNAIVKIAKKYRLKIVEDCAHAIEAEYHGRKAGTFGETGCFSFYATKNITTAEGGMIITNNPGLARKIRIISHNGIVKEAWERFSEEKYTHYQFLSEGYKYNMTDLQAALGLHQLPRIEKYWKKRQSIWFRYNTAFKDLPVILPSECQPGVRHAYHLYTLLLKLENLKYTRNKFLQKMAKEGVGTGVHYVALHLQPYYQKVFGYKHGDFPDAEWISERTVSLPLSPGLSDADVKHVIKAVHSSIES